MSTITVGFARRCRVRFPGGATARAWNCRPFGSGLIVPWPNQGGAITLDEAGELCLDLRSGRVYRRKF
jgi:hypothetical protein